MALEKENDMDNGQIFRNSLNRFANKEISKYGCSDDRKKVINNICKWADSNGVSCFAELDEYVYETYASKETAADVIISFSYECLKFGESFGKTKLTDLCIIDDPTRRSIEIVKYLHKKRSIHEITEHFVISDRTVRKILNQLYNGINFMGCHLNARVLRSKARYILQSFIHPFFIGLDRAELISFLTIMEREEQDPLYGVFISKIKGQLARQLTDTAKELSKELVVIEISKNDEELYEELYEEETSIALKDVLIHMLHTGNPGNLTVYFNDEDRELYHCIIRSYDYRSGMLMIVLEDGSEIQTDVASISIATLINQPQ